MSAPAPSADPPSSPAPRPRRPRPGRDDGETFGEIIPWQNPIAVYSYYVAIVGLMPVLGAVIGLVALLLGIAGLIRARWRPEVHGTNFAVAGIVIGTAESLVNMAGIWCIGHGLGWW